MANVNETGTWRIEKCTHNLVSEGLIIPNTSPLNSLFLNHRIMDYTWLWVTVTFRQWSHQTDLYSQSPTLWKLLTPSADQLVNILLSQIWPSLFCWVPILIGSQLHLAFTSEEMIHLFWCIMDLHQLCPPAHSLQARSPLHLGFSKNTGTFHSMHPPLRTYGTCKYWKKRVAKVNGCILCEALVTLFNFWKLLHSLHPWHEEIAVVPISTHKIYYFFVVPNCLQILLKPVSAVNLHISPSWMGTPMTKAEDSL